MFSFLDAARHWRKGIPPVAGGSLDQTEQALQAYSFFEGERQRWMQHKGLADDPQE